MNSFKKYLCFILVLCCLVVSAYTLCIKGDFVGVSANEELHVLIDAGHGGRDGGVTGVTTGEKESDVNLKIAFALKSELDDAGFKVTMTRTTQYGLTDGSGAWSKQADMRIRKKIIQENNPSLVVSLHQNFYPTSSSPRGAQVFYLKSDEKGKAFALCAQDCLNELYGKYGVKERVAMPAEYYILKCSASPSIIVECGFMSNPKDDSLLDSESFRLAIAKSVFSGITRYYSLR